MHWLVRTELRLAVPHVQDEVLIAGFGRSGHAVGDIPGVRFKVRTAGGEGHQDQADGWAEERLAACLS